MGFSEVKHLQLQDANLLGDYDNHRNLWQDMAVTADKSTRAYMGAVAPLPDDVVESLLPAVRLNPVFREILFNTQYRADKWYRCFSEYILHREWESVLKAR